MLFLFWLLVPRWMSVESGFIAIPLCEWVGFIKLRCNPFFYLATQWHLQKYYNTLASTFTFLYFVVLHFVLEEGKKEETRRFSCLIFLKSWSRIIDESLSSFDADVVLYFSLFFLNFFFNFEMNLGKRGLPSPNTQIPKVQAAATTAAATLQNC